MAVFSALFVWHGVNDVARILAEGGIALVGVCLFFPGEQVLAALAWRVLFSEDRKPSLRHTLLASWIGSAVNTLLPVATIGGEVVKTRVIIGLGQEANKALALMLVDKTVQALAVACWAVVGITILAFTVSDVTIVVGTFISLVLLLFGIGIFILLQVRGGLNRAAGIISKHFQIDENSSFFKRLKAIDCNLRGSYTHIHRIVLGSLLRLLQRVFLAGEVVLIGCFVGASIGFVEAIIFKGIVGAVRGASFAVPGGIGVQEGSYVAIGILLGYSPETMLAVSLATRIREILPSIPALIWWQILEARAILGGNNC